jgi:hypothetical protein
MDGTDFKNFDRLRIRESEVNSADPIVFREHAEISVSNDRVHLEGTSGHER